MPKTVGQRATAQEKKVAAALGGKRQPASGSQWRNKADVKTERFSVDVKFTDKQQYILKKSDIDKLRREACFEHKDWAFYIDISGRKVVVMDAEVLEELSLDKS